MKSKTKEAPPVALDAVVADSPAQFCARVSMSASTFFELVKAGRLRTTKLGRRTLIPRSEILRFLGEVEPPETGR